MQVALFGCRHIKEARKTSHVFFFSFQYDRYSNLSVFFPHFSFLRFFCEDEVENELTDQR